MSILDLSGEARGVLFVTGGLDGLLSPLAETTTDANGDFLFEDLPSGQYVVVVSPIEDYDGAVEPTDVTLRFLRDDERVASIYNDDGTDRTMARLSTGREGHNFLGVEVPKEFVAEPLDVAIEAGRPTHRRPSGPCLQSAYCSRVSG